MTRAEFRKIYERERRRFGRYFGWLKATKLRFVSGRCVSRGHCAFRDLAFTDLDENEIVMHERALELPAENILGLIRHELGHMADIDVLKRGAEQRADDLAESATGQKIRYDLCDIQTIGRGKYPRPRRLPH